MSGKTYKFHMEMTCEGCSGAATRILEKQKNADKVSSFDVSLESQTVTVTSKMPSDELLEVLKKTGKKVELLEEVE